MVWQTSTIVPSDLSLLRLMPSVILSPGCGQFSLAHLKQIQYSGSSRMPIYDQVIKRLKMSLCVPSFTLLPLGALTLRGRKQPTWQRTDMCSQSQRDHETCQQPQMNFKINPQVELSGNFIPGQHLDYSLMRDLEPEAPVNWQKP